MVRGAWWVLGAGCWVVRAGWWVVGGTLDTLLEQRPDVRPRALLHLGAQDAAVEVEPRLDAPLVLFVPGVPPLDRSKRQLLDRFVLEVFRRRPEPELEVEVLGEERLLVELTPFIHVDALARGRGRRQLLVHLGAYLQLGQPRLAVELERVRSRRAERQARQQHERQWQQCSPCEHRARRLQAQLDGRPWRTHPAVEPDERECCGWGHQQGRET